MEELISIIIPVYKVEKYLSRCIESVMAQTYSNIEIILIDDGSPDKCPEICDNYADKDLRIKVVHKKNGGLSDARNAGITLAEGKYISFLDSDDYVHPRMYQELLHILKKEGADVSFCNLNRVYSEEYELNDIQDGTLHIYSGKQAVKNILDKNLHVVSVIACGKLYKKELFESIRFPVGKLHEDEFTTYKIFYKCTKVVFMDKGYYYYFQRDDGIMGTRKKVFSADGLEAYEQMGDFFQKTSDRDIFYLVKYKYMYMLHRASVDLKKSGDQSEIDLAEELEEKYRSEYKENIAGIKTLKRKIRLWLYRWTRIDI